MSAREHCIGLLTGERRVTGERCEIAVRPGAFELAEFAVAHASSPIGSKQAQLLDR